MENRTDEQLMQSAARGDDNALETLIARSLKLMYGFAYRFTHNRAEAEDITQEVFVKVWRNVKKFDHAKPFKPWLYRIAKNTCLDFVKRKYAVPFSAFDTQDGGNWLAQIVPDGAPAPDALAERNMLAGKLAAAVKSLPQKYANVVSLHNGQGLRFNEIARATNESQNTVKSRYRRALFALKKILRT